MLRLSEKELPCCDMPCRPSRIRCVPRLGLARLALGLEERRQIAHRGQRLLVIRPQRPLAALEGPPEELFGLGELAVGLEERPRQVRPRGLVLGVGRGRLGELKGRAVQPPAQARADLAVDAVEAALAA